MARSIAIIKSVLTANFMANATIQNAYGFADGLVFENVFSKVSFESNLFDVFSFALFLFEKLFDQHKQEIDTALYEQKSGTPRWYRNMALAFQYGFDLLDDSDKFDNTEATIDQIEASQIIKYCSVKESFESNKLTIKVAGESGNTLIPLTVPQLESFAEYMQEIKYAGVRLNIVNNPADKLKLVMSIYRDVLVIDENGNSIQNGGKPVETAVRAYMKSLPFDGVLVLNDLIANLRTVDGVDDVNILNATSSHWNSVGLGFSEFQPINVRTVPMSGYFEIVDFTTVTYVV